MVCLVIGLHCSFHHFKVHSLKNASQSFFCFFSSFSEYITFGFCMLFSGGMSDHLSSPPPNGYPQGISPCSSPGGISSVSPNMMMHNGSNNNPHHKISPLQTTVANSQQVRPGPNTMRISGNSRPDHLAVPEVLMHCVVGFLCFFLMCFL